MFMKDDICCQCSTKKATQMICIQELTALKHIGKLNSKEIMNRCDSTLLFKNFSQKLEVITKDMPFLKVRVEPNAPPQNPDVLTGQ